MEVKSKVCGFYKFKISKRINGKLKIKKETKWIPNLITNYGLDILAYLGITYLYYCHVGSGSTTPTNSDTALVSFINSAATTTKTQSVLSSSPYYLKINLTYRFNEGEATGNLTEVGISNTAITGNLFSRALILDGSGNPTTLTILSDEVLDVYYELRFYPKITDATGTITFTGNIGGTYNWTLRLANAGVYNTQYDGWSFYDNHNTIKSMVYRYQPVYYFPYATGDSIASLTSKPGNLNTLDESSFETYTDGHHYIDYNIIVNLNYGNISGGIKTFYFQVNFGTYQLEFNNKIPKTDTDKLTLTIRFYWDRV